MRGSIWTDQGDAGSWWRTGCLCGVRITACTPREHGVPEACSSAVLTSEMRRSSRRAWAVMRGRAERPSDPRGCQNGASAQFRGGLSDRRPPLLVPERLQYRGAADGRRPARQHSILLRPRASTKILERRADDTLLPVWCLSGGRDCADNLARWTPAKITKHM